MTVDDSSTADDARERVRSRALRAFGRCIAEASRAYEAELERAASEEGIPLREVPASPDYTMGAAVASALGAMFWQGNDGSRHLLDDDSRCRLERFYAALRPPVKPKDEACALACALIDEFAPVHKEAVRLEALDDAERPPPPEPFDRWLTSLEVVKATCQRLTVDVHPGFRALQGQESRVGELLARYTSSRGKRHGAALGAPGIVAALNEMCSPSGNGMSGPLGITDAHSVVVARGRFKAASRKP